MSNEQRIQERVKGRALAKTLLSMAELEEQSKDVFDGFWDHMRTVGPIANGVEIGAGQMSDEEAIAFEKTSIEFGQYRGDTYGNIPLKYLAWVADSGIQLRRYMQSRRAQSRED